MWYLSPVHLAFDVTERISASYMCLFTDHFNFLKRLYVWESFPACSHVRGALQHYDCRLKDLQTETL